MRPMLATKFDGTLPASYAVEPKLDGVRVLISVNAMRRSVKFRSRTGKELKALSHLKAEVLVFAADTRGDIILDAEAVSGSFFETVPALRKSATAADATIWVFDLIGFGTYAARRGDLERIARPTSRVRLVPVSWNAPVADAYSSALADGFEGIIVKDAASDYEAGERSSAWAKLKPSETYDLPVVGIEESVNAGEVGAIVVDFNGVKVRVGAGFKSKGERRAVWGLRSALIGRTIEVAAQSVTPAGSLRHPSFVRIRDDK